MECKQNPPKYNKYKEENEREKETTESCEKSLEAEMFPESLVFALWVSGSAKEWRMALNAGQFVFLWLMWPSLASSVTEAGDIKPCTLASQTSKLCFSTGKGEDKEVFSLIIRGVIYKMGYWWESTITCVKNNHKEPWKKTRKMFWKGKEEQAVPQ